MTDATLARARAGDSDAFSELTDPYRRELQVHCYRILGSFQDAEDMLQETLLSAWQALDRFDGRSLRAWLYRIATNRCLNYLRDASRRPKVTNMSESRFSFDEATPSDEPWWLEPYPDAFVDDVDLGPEARYDARESIALSFVAGLQRLPVQQRAALVLRDVLGFSASEVAEMLESTPASVNSALQRARSRVPHPDGPDHVPMAASGQESEVVDRFVEAFQRGRSRRGCRSADRRRQILDAARAVRVPRTASDRRVPPQPRFLGSRPQAGPDQSQQPTGVRLLPPRPERRRPSGQRDHGADHGNRRDLGHHEVRRQRFACPLWPATHRGESLARAPQVRARPFGIFADQIQRDTERIPKQPTMVPRPAAARSSMAGRFG